VHCDKP